MGDYETGLLALMAWGALGIVVYLASTRLIRTIADRIAGQPEERILGGLTDHRLLRVLHLFFHVLRVLIVVAYSLMLLRAFEFSAALVDFIFVSLANLWEATLGIFDRQLFTLGEQVITLRFFVTLIVILIGVSLGATAVRRGLRRHVLSRLGLDVGVQETLATVAGYTFLALGGLIALDLVGLDLSTLALLAGALSIGIGFGLQNIANNFISGLILLIERPVKVGDRIEVGDIHGEVTRIAARSTSVRTNDNIDIIVPNAELISGRVVNWSQNDRRIRFRVPVAVAYGTDVDLAMRLMEEAGSALPEVLQSPAPAARFLAFGDSSLDLELRVWTVKRLHRKGRIVSDVNRAIYRKFAEHNISIPFPQRDIHVVSWPTTPPSFDEVYPNTPDDTGDHVVDDGEKGAH